MTESRAPSFAVFEETCNRIIREFKENAFLKKIASGKFSIKDYHSFLTMIFHQTFFVPSTMGLAASLCPPQRLAIRDYLIHHADEEKDHWKWVVEDLKNTGYRGLDPQSMMPRPACMQFISFSYFLALKYPVARLGLPAVLEGISAAYASNGAKQVKSLLKLNDKQLIFAFGHGDADVAHAKEIFEVLKVSDLDEPDWKWLTYAAETTGRLYGSMLEEAVNDHSYSS